ncbi:MAG: Wzz/FepE/Etk N-terminal domain-containing protein [Atribacterota bacterium]|nr:Wzz/FepE/Etk N-terminal domain-containing protein [Atribacterota bacterium]MDD5637972.1 Wzz/FepE/Etk N-terminal domain-containing protein [Atribacterota bacterium]
MEEEIDLREYIKVLIKRKWLILTIFLLLVITAGIVSYLVLLPIYESSVTFKIAQINDELLFDTNDIENKVKSDHVLQKVIDNLQLDVTLRELASIIKIDNINESGYVRLASESTSPETARDIVLSTVNQFVGLNQTFYQTKIDLLKKEKQSLESQMTLEREKIEEAERLRLDIINSEGLSLTEKQIQINLLLNYSTQIRENYNLLANQYYTLENQILNSNNFEIINYPSVPQSPIKPNKKLNLAIAGVLGLFLGVFIAFFTEFWQSNGK